MKKYLLILTLFFGSFSVAFAQDDQGKKPRDIEALYVAYVTQQLQFTPEEAQKFWPLHTQFANELKSISNDLPELEKQQARLDIKKKYQGGFNKIIGSARCERFYGLRDAFIEKLTQRRIQNQQRQKPLRRGQ
jgi:hypothetical protein